MNEGRRVLEVSANRNRKRKRVQKKEEEKMTRECVCLSRYITPPSAKGPSKRLKKARRGTTAFPSKSDIYT